MNKQFLKSPQNIGLELEQMRREAKLTDLSFVCRKNDNSFHVLDAHQVIFSTLSAELKMLFDIAKQRQPYEKVVMILEPANYIIMEKLIQYVYTGEITANATEKQNLVHLCELLKLKISLPLDTAPAVEFDEISLESCNQMSSCHWTQQLHEISYQNLHSHWTQTSCELENLVKSKQLALNNACNNETKITNSRGISPDVTFKDTEICEQKSKAISFAIQIQIKKNINHQSNLTNKRVRKSVKRFQIQNKNDSIRPPTNILKTSKIFPRKISMNCKFCETSITTKCRSFTISNLHRHMLIIHDKIRHFNCDKCPHSALTKEHLRVHNLTIHDKFKGFICKKCPFSSSTKDKLKRHLIKVHRITRKEVLKGHYL